MTRFEIDGAPMEAGVELGLTTHLRRNGPLILAAQEPTAWSAGVNYLQNLVVAGAPQRQSATIQNGAAAPNVGDWVEWKLPMLGGTFQNTNQGWLWLHWERGPNLGVVNVTVDGVAVATLDTYAAAYAFVTGGWELSALGFDLTRAALRTVRLTVAPKNAASTGTYIVLCSVGFFSTD